MPAVLGAVDGPAERRAAVLVVGILQRWMLRQDQAYERCIAVPCGPVKCGGVVLAEGTGYGQSRIQHQARSPGIVVARRMREVAATRRRQGSGEVRILTEQVANRRFV